MRLKISEVSAHIDHHIARTNLPANLYRQLPIWRFTMAPTTTTPTPAINPPSTRSTRTPTRRRSLKRTPPVGQYSTRARPKKSRINWTFKMEEAMLQGLVRAVRRRLRADKKEGWEMALKGVRAHARAEPQIQSGIWS